VEYGSFMPQTEMLVGRMCFRPEEMERIVIRLEEVCRPSLLFDIRDDEAQEHDLAGTALEGEYEEKLRAALHEVEAPESQFERLGL